MPSRKRWRSPTASSPSSICPAARADSPGNLARAGYQVVGSDISMEMMQQAAKLPRCSTPTSRGYVRADAEALPFPAEVGRLRDEHPFPVPRRSARRAGACCASSAACRGAGSSPTTVTSIRFATACGKWRARSGLTKRPFERVSVKSMKAEFEDAGLRVREDHRGAPLALRQVGGAGRSRPHRSRRVSRSSSQGTKYADLEVTEKLGEGKRSVVYRARWQGREVGLKVYKPAAIANHARKHKLPLAEFEHRRNKAFFEARGMAKYVAEPLGFVVEPGFQMSLQECRRRRGVLLRAARSRGLHLAALHGRSRRARVAEPRGEALRHRPACHERDGRPARRHAQAVRLQPDPVHRAAAEPLRRAGAQAGVVRARIPRPAQAGALQQLRSRGTQAAQVLRGRPARSKT